MQLGVVRFDELTSSSLFLRNPRSADGVSLAILFLLVGMMLAGCYGVAHLIGRCLGKRGGVLFICAAIALVVAVLWVRMF